MSESGDARVTVVGAGVVGLSCAVMLAEAGYEVEVLTRDHPLDTTSAVAGGLWLPYLAEPPEIVARWSLLTLDRFLRIARSPRGAPTPASPDGFPHGITLREGYLLGTGRSRPPWADGAPDLGLAALEVTEAGTPAPGRDHGWRLRVPIVDMALYLPYLMGRLQRAGGRVVRRSLTALPEQGIVVNCTGLGARDVAGDPAVRPVRGQVVWTTNPGLTTWWMDESVPDAPVYVIPHAGHVVIGGTAEPDEWSTTPDREASEHILKRAADLVPALHDAAVLAERAGLRPVRTPVRLETVRTAGGAVVHCYGHGGSGVTTSWGCADDVLAAVNAVA